MSAPKYIYKILPATAAPPSPLPLALPLSDLDARDGFLHLSTSTQLLGTLKLFFPDAESVYILRVPYEKVERSVKWENGKGDVVELGWGTEGYFPHVYANGGDGGLRLGREEVDRVGRWVRGVQGWSAEGWSFEEDLPRE